MNLLVIFRAGLSTGTILLIAAIGEILAERSGVMNLGVEGMMLIGAMAAFKVAHVTQNAWLGLIAGILAGGILSLMHGLVVISMQADQTVSGLSLTFLGTGLALVLGEGLTGLNTPTIPSFTIPLLSKIPYIGPIFFSDFNLLVYMGYLLIPIAWYFIYKTRPGMHMRAVGEKPSAADSLGISVYGTRYLYTFVGGCLAGLAGATISIAISPGWYSSLTTSGQGWIAIALVIFAMWDPLRAAIGALLFGFINAFQFYCQAAGLTLIPGYILRMLPYLFTIGVLVLITRWEAAKKRLGPPGALGVPFEREA